MTATEQEIKDKAKQKMEYIAERLNKLKPETVGGLCLRLLVDSVPTIEVIDKLLDDVEAIEKGKNQ